MTTLQRRYITGQNPNRQMWQHPTVDREAWGVAYIRGYMKMLGRWGNFQFRYW